MDCNEFYAAIEPAILAAQQRVLIQTMTFEMDSVGTRLWEALIRSPAAEKILCADAFSLAKISDSLVFGPKFWTDGQLRSEAKRTRRRLRSGSSHGVQVVVTNPMGLLWHKFPLRNHKKIMVVDDTAFLGGINFSEHNFAWHDLMLQTLDTQLVEALARDFHLTAAGVNQKKRHIFGDTRLYLLDGHHSKQDYEALFQETERAHKSIDVISPYLSNPLLSRLKKISAGVKVRIINPARNNKPILQRALLNSAADSNLEVLFYQPRMSHMKAILIDGERLILGSYNFDFVGYELQQEVALSTSHCGLVDDFRRRVLEPTLRLSAPVARPPAGAFGWAGWTMYAAQKYVQLLRRLSR